MISALRLFLLSDFRQKYFRAMAALLGFMVVFLLIAGEMSLNEQRRIILDIGFSMVLLVSVGIGAYGMGLRYHSFLKDGLWAFLSLQGFQRWKLIVLLAVLTLIEQFVFVVFSGVAIRLLLLFGKYPVIELDFWIAVISIFLESGIVAALTLLVGFWARSFLLLPVAYAFSLIGHSVALLFDIASKLPDSLMFYVSEVVRTVFPHLFRLNFRHAVTDSITKPMTEVASAFTYASVWIVLLTLFSILAFRKRELVV